jgi:acylphosphatase
MELVRYRVIVHGTVQGVAFRAATRSRAVALGASGWVRNRPDGTVEAVFEGEPEGVRALVEFCRQGPRFARVVRLEEFPEPPEDLVGFEIR